MPGGRGGGRGGGGARGRDGPLPRNVQISKKISWLLRHGASEEGLQLGPGGFLSVQQVLENRKIRSLKVTFDELREIVQDNDKQRFTMILAADLGQDGELQTAIASATEKQEDGGGGEGKEGAEISQPPLPSTSPTDYLIRANQGHSLKVDSTGLLRPITLANLPDAAIHGTTHAAWPLIVASGGLKPMGRTHVHFAPGLPAGFASITTTTASSASAREEDGSAAAEVVAAPVISGMRNSSTVLMFLDLPRALDAGLKFWTSDNGVVLSEGNTEGLVPLELFRSVEDRTSEGLLLKNGEVGKEAPAKWGVKGRRGGKT